MNKLSREEEVKLILKGLLEEGKQLSAAIIVLNQESRSGRGGDLRHAVAPLEARYNQIKNLIKAYQDEEQEKAREPLDTFRSVWWSSKIDETKRR